MTFQVYSDPPLFKLLEWLLKTIDQVANLTVLLLAASPFCFVYNKEVFIITPSNLLTGYDFDLTRLIDNHKHTLLAYGSEFHPIDELASIYQNHNLFPFFANLHQEGMEYIYKETLTGSERMAELKANID